MIIIDPNEYKTKNRTGKIGKLLEKDKVNLLMLSLHSQPTLIEVAQESRQWCEQYRDKDAVIFSRCTPIQ